MPSVRLLILLCLWPASFGAAQSTVPPARTALLDKGVNLSHWLWIPGSRTGQARAEFISTTDLKLIRSTGMTHVRLPFEPSDIWDADKHDLKAAGLAELLSAMEACLKADLGVIIDAHPTAASPWAGLDAQGKSDELERFWSALATKLSSTNPDRVFLEILNEPHDIKDPALWPAAQTRLAAAIRAAAPKHTIIATCDDWSNASGLLHLKPLSDPNIIYTFHFYEPHNFTHQGAEWGWPPWKHMKGLPYPSSPEALAPIAAKIENRQARDATIAYGKERWDAARIRAEMNIAADWAAKNHVPIYCGEFGVYAAFTPRDSRIAWLHDTTAALIELKIGWAMWDYTGGFALAPGEPGKRVLDADVARALNLTVPK